MHGSTAVCAPAECRARLAGALFKQEGAACYAGWRMLLSGASHYKHIRTEQISQHSPGQLAQEKHCFSVVILCSTGTAHLKPAMHLARLLSTVIEGLSR